MQKQTGKTGKELEIELTELIESYDVKKNKTEKEQQRLLGYKKDLMELKGVNKLYSDMAKIMANNGTLEQFLNVNCSQCGNKFKDYKGLDSHLKKTGHTDKSNMNIDVNIKMK